MVGGGTANHADGVQLGHVLGDRHKARHRFERTTEVILIEAGHDHPSTLAREPGADLHERFVKELALVDSNDIGLAGEKQNLGRG